MTIELQELIQWAGLGQLCVLIASALVPVRLNWKEAFAQLPILHRQLYWTYGGYVVLAITANGLISIVNASELASGSLLARCFCGYVAIFWGLRLALQGVFHAAPYLCHWWLIAGYHSLTVTFALLTAVYAWAALSPG